MPESIQLITTTSSGTRIRVAAVIETEDGRIYFLKSPFSLKDEIKAMRGSRWHQFDDKGPYAGKKIWSVEDCPRNRFQLAFLQGQDVYAPFDRPLIRHVYRPYFRDGVLSPPLPHQVDMADAGLTYHYQIFAAEMGTGKSLSAQMVIEHGGIDSVYWVGPKTSLPYIKREFKLWGFPFDRINVEFSTYDGLVTLLEAWDDRPIPQCFIIDESSRCKNATAQRTEACQTLADMIRKMYGMDGYVIEMSGTPSPKSPVDWHSQAEIAWPGFLKEGSVNALKERLAFMELQTFASGTFKRPTGWRDNEQKCAVCGKVEAEHGGDHYHRPSKNEVAYLYERLRGLVIIKHKKDCLGLPDKRYRLVYCKPMPSTQRAAEAIIDGAVNAITGMTLLRELSDGFQYREEKQGTSPCGHCKDGTVQEWVDPANVTYRNISLLPPEVLESLEERQVPCPHCRGTKVVPRIVRVAKELPCPKEAALRQLLDENEEVGRLVIFAGFTGSIDRIVLLCQQQNWDVVRCDQGAYQVWSKKQLVTDVEPLDYWADFEHPRVAFVANPESGGMSLTLTEARMAVYWSNSFKSEFRHQSEDRIHRIGMDLNKGCTIVDLIHLPTDERVLEILRENRRLELMTMGEVMGANAGRAA